MQRLIGKMASISKNEAVGVIRPFGTGGSGSDSLGRLSAFGILGAFGKNMDFGSEGTFGMMKDLGKRAFRLIAHLRLKRPPRYDGALSVW